MCLDACIEKLDKFLRVFLAVMMALLVVDVTWQVLTRFILPQPSSFTEEVARFLLIWVSLIGAAYAYRLNSHLGFDLLVKKLPVSEALFYYRLCCLLVVIFAISVLIIGGCNLVYLTWSLGQSSPVLNIPMAFIYSVVPFSGCLFTLYSGIFFKQASNAIAE
ncbi:TRAP transporter small permease [Catenovulum maritimum]|uniref:TRAP transporter small permease protein n=1 Tax=Catenovulum maritimum TaxID=1513271 RepID=A0A0J8GVW2_9ALTE|nr:TRAP transporter small permease [Catenovulum maritimum]KMT66897.1 C4-dicarboxylate ABC transporter permease [Catenovulum maritimum]